MYITFEYDNTIKDHQFKAKKKFILRLYSVHPIPYISGYIRRKLSIFFVHLSQECRV